MPRLFIGLDLPSKIDMSLQLMAGGIPGARWQSPEQLHLTLHFIGDVDGGTARRLAAALQSLEAPSFELALRGAGVFPLRGQPRSLWIGVSDSEALLRVHRRCARILDKLGLPRESRRYTPHVTIARLKRSPEREVAAWIQSHMLFASASFPVTRVLLYSSVLAPSGPKYRVEAATMLGPADAGPAIPKR